MRKEKISVVIPCYNSQNMIGIVIDGVRKVIESKPEYDYEIVLVNDGSKDGTWSVIRKLTEDNSKIIAINFSKNFGQHSALMAAYREVSGDYILGLDDDGEHNPKEMFQLIDKLKEGYDYVCADYDTNQSKFRSLGTRFNNLMATYMINKPKEIDLSSYYVMRKFVIDEIIRYGSCYPYVGGLMLRATNNLGTVKLTRQKRLEGQSGYNLKKMLGLWFNGFTAFSIKPLRLASGVGLFASVIGFVWFIALIIKKLFFVQYALGYTSIMACIIFFSGMIMMMLGVIGEYVGRMYISMNNAPQYVIREVVGRKENED